MKRLEAIAAFIHLRNNERVLFVASYIPPTGPAFTHDLDAIFSTPSPVIIIGDLNCKHIAWNCTTNDTNGTALLSYCTDNNIIIHHPDLPTHHPHNAPPSVLDIALSRRCPLSKLISAPHLSSDHNPIAGKLLLRPSIVVPKTIMNYKQANWKRYKSLLEDSPLPTHAPSSAIEIDQALTSLEAAIHGAASQAIPQLKPPSHPLILPTSLLHTLSLKNYYRRRYQRTRLPIFLRVARMLTQSFLTNLQLVQNAKWHSFLRSLHPQKSPFWKITKYFTSSSKSIPPPDLQ